MRPLHTLCAPTASDSRSAPVPAALQQASSSSCSASTGAAASADQSSGLGPATTSVGQSSLASLQADGGAAPTHFWSQTPSDVTVHVFAPAMTKARMVQVDVQERHLRVGLQSQPALIDSELAYPVHTEEDDLTACWEVCKWEWDGPMVDAVATLGFAPKVPVALQLQTWQATLRSKSQRDYSQSQSWPQPRRMTMCYLLIRCGVQAQGTVCRGAVSY